MERRHSANTAEKMGTVGEMMTDVLDNLTTTKVDKEEGMGLSQNSYTDAEKDLVATVPDRVPYTGADRDVNLGERTLTTKAVVTETLEATEVNTSALTSKDITTETMESLGGFKKSSHTDSDVLLAGGGTKPVTDFEPVKGEDDNFVTDAEKTKINNLPEDTNQELEDLDTEKVPYTGSTQSVDLGVHSVETTSVIYKETPPVTKDPLQRYYDADSNTTKFVRLDGGETNDNQEIGGEFTNVDSIELTEKMLVSAVPLAGNRKGMARLDISSKTSVENFLGMITVPSIAVNGRGLVTFLGEVDADTFGLAENAQIYAGITPGTWSLTPPAKGYYTIIIGTVVVSAHNGKVFLKPRVLPKLNDLSDVTNNATEGQPVIKKADGTWAGSDTIKINKTQPASGLHTVEGHQTVTGNQTVQGSHSSESVSTGNITSTGKVSANDTESASGFKKTGATNEDFLLGAGGTKSFTALKQGIYQLFKPDGSQAIIEVNVAGDVLISGNILVNGQAYEIEAEKISTSEELIELRRGATTGLPLGALAGFIIKLYDGVNDGMLAIDKDGVMRIGDVGDLQPVMTREEVPVDKSLTFFNTITSRAETIPTATRKTVIAPNDDFFLNDSEEGNNPKRISGQNLKDDIKEYVGTDLMFYLDESDTGVTLGLGDEVYVTEDAGIYPSVTLNIITD